MLVFPVSVLQLCSAFCFVKAARKVVIWVHVCLQSPAFRSTSCLPHNRPMTHNYEQVTNKLLMNLTLLPAVFGLWQESRVLRRSKNTERTHQIGFEPMTIFMWQNNANYCTALKIYFSMILAKIRFIRIKLTDLLKQINIFMREEISFFTSSKKFRRQTLY